MLKIYDEKLLKIYDEKLLKIYDEKLLKIYEFLTFWNIWSVNLKFKTFSATKAHAIQNKETFSPKKKQTKKHAN